MSRVMWISVRLQSVFIFFFLFPSFSIPVLNGAVRYILHLIYIYIYIHYEHVHSIIYYGIGIRVGVGTPRENSRQKYSNSMQRALS